MPSEASESSAAPRPAADGPDTRTRLVHAAMELFALQGYHRTGLAQIARHAGARPGSLYYFFPTKEDLLAATLEARLELLGPEVLEPIWERIDDPVERVFGLLAGYRRMLAATDFAHGCPIGNLVLELAESHPHARALLAANFDNWLDAVERCFADARDRLPAEVEPRTLALHVLVTMEGAVMLARTYRSFEPYDAAVVTLRDHVERLLRDGGRWSADEARARAAWDAARRAIEPDGGGRTNGGDATRAAPRLPRDTDDRGERNG